MRPRRQGIETSGEAITYNELKIVDH